MHNHIQHTGKKYKSKVNIVMDIYKMVENLKFTTLTGENNRVSGHPARVLG